jgi:type 1 glutamine amidotransferase
MERIRLMKTKCALVGASAVLAIVISSLQAQAPAGASRPRGSQNGIPAAIFNALDADGDGSLTRSEMESRFNSWFTNWDTGKSGALTQNQIATGLSSILPPQPAARPGAGNMFNPAGNSTPMTAPQPAVDAMMTALPTTPGAKPLHPRKVLVYAHTGPGGFVHASIPLAAKTVEALGNQGGLWSTTVSYDPASISAENLKQYDAIFLDSTTACFLDDKDPAVTAARRAAFMSFVRSGKGIVGIHAATDSYHSDCLAAQAAANSSGAAQNTIANLIAGQWLAQGDPDHDGTMSQQEFTALADSWFDKMDTDKTGKISQADFAARFTSAMTASRRPGGPGNEPKPVLQWPEFNTLIGGYFKFHWSDPQLITVKIDDPNSPLTAMFHGKEFEIHDETYTFAQESFSRRNVHVLTSIDYDKMSPEDKAKEANPRTDADYALSYIRREGRGRVFYEGHGHSDRVYAMTPMLEHLRAGIQYALGDLKADDSPSSK